MAEERLQKIIARAGLASRRKAEEMILEGRVTVNGKVVTELGAKADPERDHIKVDGKLIRPETELVYILLNKPRGVMTTVSDPQGRLTVIDLLGKRVKQRVYPVGRLDYHSEGLLLLTNDGELAAHLMAPKSHIEKTYHVKVNGYLTPEQEEKFRTGVPVYGRRTAPAGLRLLKRAANPWYEVTLTEGRTRQIRLMFQHFGRLVEKIKRVRLGFLTLGKLKPGEFRMLTPREVERLRSLLRKKAGGARAAGKKPERARAGK